MKKNSTSIEKKGILSPEYIGAKKWKRVQQSYMSWESHICTKRIAQRIDQTTGNGLLATEYGVRKSKTIKNYVVRIRPDVDVILVMQTLM